MQLMFSRMLSIASAFIVFGIIDNGVMVISGSFIEDILGKSFNISTIAAAGFGNTLSDIVGIVCGRYIEKRLFKTLTKDTSTMNPKFVILSEAIGITIGCLLGMLPILFL